MLKKDSIEVGLRSLREMLRTIPLFNYFRVHMCGNLTVPPHWRIEPRVIDDFHLLMVLGGKGQYVVDDVEVPLHRGRLILISSGVEYSAEQDHADPPWIVPVRFFVYDNRTHRPSGLPREPFALSHVTPHVERVQEVFESLHRQHLLNQGPFRTGFCSTLIHHILCDLLLECGHDARTSAVPDERILQVQQFIAQHPMDRSTVPELAKMAHLSEKYFTRLFRQQTGVTPKRYQLNSRISHARMLLEDGASVKATAMQMGYPDPYVFSKQFKALLGLSPNQV